MEYLLTPGRMKYLKEKKPDGCIFCEDSVREEGMVLYEGEYCCVLMNKYPYNPAHILVIPRRHVAVMDEMTRKEKMEFMDVTDMSVRILKEAVKPDGFNIGMNLGSAAGAGIENHLHLHIVPRWSGDTNFLTVLGEIRLIPEEVEKTREILLPWFQNKQEV